MTREEACNSMTLQDAIQVFKDTNAYGTMDIAKTVILEALEQKTSDDCISRKVLIEKLHGKFADGFDSDKWWNSTAVLCAIYGAPSVAPLTTSQQATTEYIIKSTIKEYIGKPCDDVTELFLALNKDLCERIRKGE